MDKGWIKGIISLPANLFYGTGIAACILIIDKEGAANRQGIFMIDASHGYVKDGKHGLIIIDSFDSVIRFPKKKDSAYGYEKVLEKHEKPVIESYDLEETETELYITEQVNNILFVKETVWDKDQ